MKLPNLRFDFAPLALSVLIGAMGGALAWLIGSPMPFLLGAFGASALVSVTKLQVFGVRPMLPMPFRNLFVAVIGVMIGGSFHPGIFGDFSQLWLPAVGVLVFIALALAVNFTIFRLLGGYDRNTAFFAAMPGGLIESIALGEKAGCDAQTLSLQQFSRIALVITSVPFLLFFWTGEKVGSAAGMTLGAANTPIGWFDWLVFAIAALAGLYGGKALKLPASILVGPLILSAIAHMTGLTDTGPPQWLIATAQVIVGAGLGARFSGFSGGRLAKVFLLAILSVSAMLLLDAGLVYVLTIWVDQPFEVLLISFAPGGVTETALIALSLNANPVFVTMLHVFRIIITVIVGGIAAKMMTRYPAT